MGLKTGENKKREMTTIYKAVLNSGSRGKKVDYITPFSMSQYGQKKSVITDCLKDRTGPFSPGVTVPCVDGKQTWVGYNFPGLLSDPSKVDNVQRNVCLVFLLASYILRYPSKVMYCGFRLNND